LEKISTFRCEKIHADTDSRIPAKNFAEIGKAEVTKRKKGCYFAPFSGASGAISPKILQDHSFPISYHSTTFFSNSSSFRGYISENVFQTRYNISVKHVGFSPTITYFVYGY